MRYVFLDNAKWILTLLIVLYHIQLVGDHSFYSSFMFVKNLGDCVVPAFSIISGFLFWSTVRTFSDLKEKYKRRVFSLLVPYLLWNLINTFLLNLQSGKNGCSLLDLNIWNNLVMWNSSPHFWYIFMLMFWTVLSPILYFLYCRKAGVFLLFILSFAYLLYKGETILHSRFIYMIYTWAGLIGFYYPDLLKKIRISGKKKKIIFTVLFLVAYLGIYFVYCNKPIGMEIKVWLYGIRAVFLLSLLINLPLTKIGSKTCFRYSFWIFAIHFWLDYFFGGFFSRIISNAHLYQLVTWSVVSTFALGSGFLLNKISPQLFKLFTGNREGKTYEQSSKSFK